MSEHDDFVIVPLARVQLSPQLRRKVDAQIVFAVRIPHCRIIDKDLIAVVKINPAAICITQGKKFNRCVVITAP